MKAAFLALVLAVTPACMVYGQASSTAFVGVSVVPMDRERILTNQTVIVTDGNIAALGPAATVRIPAGARRIDGAGRYLMPGLVDMHAHLAKTGAATDDDENRRLSLVFLAHGVTTVRNMAGTPGILALREDINGGRLLGPQIITTGPANGETQVTVRRITSAAVGDSFVVADKAAGYDAIKVTGVTPEGYDAILAAARREAMEVYGHVPPAVGFERVIRGGLRSAEHVIPFAFALTPADAPRTSEVRGAIGRLAPRYADWSRLPPLAARLREADVWVCPTLVVAQVFTASEKRRRLNDPTMRWVPKRLRDAWAPQADVEAPPDASDLLDFGLTLTKRMHDAGVGLLLGSDDMNPFLVAGASLHEELSLFVRAGLTPFQALRAGTSDAARFLRKEREFGTIAVGQRADLLLLDANPLSDVANAAKRSGVMVRGRWFTAAELQNLLREVADAFSR